MTAAITERIIEVDQQLKALSTRVKLRRRKIIVAIDACSSAEALTKADLDGALFALSELGEMKERAIELTQELRRLRAEA